MHLGSRQILAGCVIQRSKLSRIYLNKFHIKNYVSGVVKQLVTPVRGKKSPTMWHHKVKEENHSGKVGVFFFVCFFLKVESHQSGADVCGAPDTTVCLSCLPWLMFVEFALKCLHRPFIFTLPSAGSACHLVSQVRIAKAEGTLETVLGDCLLLMTKQAAAGSALEPRPLGASLLSATNRGCRISRSRSLRSESPPNAAPLYWKKSVLWNNSRPTIKGMKY